MKKISLYLTIVSLVLLPTAALAGSGNCDDYNTGIFRGAYPATPPCVIDTPQQIFVVASNILQILLGLVAGLFVVFMIKGGISYMASMGDTDRVRSARSTIANSIIGLVVILAAFGIIRLLAGAIGASIK